MKKDDNKSNDVKEDKTKSDPNETLTIWQKTIYFIRSLTVEPFIILYTFPMILSFYTVQKINTDKACRINLNYTEEFCAKIVNEAVEDNENDTAVLTDISVIVSNMNSWQSPLSNSIPLIMILFVGAWSDRTGRRKLLMIIPVIGEMICSVGLILATYFFLEWPLWATAVIEALPTALSGGLSFAMMATYSHLADVTTVESRTFRIGAFQFVLTISTTIASALGGLLSKHVSYYGAFFINFIIYGMCLIYTLLKIHDIRVVETESTTLLEGVKNFFHPKHVWNTVSFLFQSKDNQRLLIVLVILAETCIGGAIEGQEAVRYLYQKLKGMDSVDMSMVDTYALVLSTIGTAVSFTILAKYFKLHDTVIAMIATVSQAVSSAYYGLIPSKLWFYGGPVLNFFGNSIGFCLRSLSTKVVEASDVAKLIAVISLVEAIRPLITIPMFNQVFGNTQDIYPGTVFLFGSAMIVPAFFIFVVLYKLMKKQEKDTVKDPNAKEMHAYDNDVTAL